MRKVTLGNTGITVNKNGFGALPIQRVSKDEAVYLLHKAYEHGIRFYDTARFYTDSEKSWGWPLKRCGEIFILLLKPWHRRRRDSGRIWNLHFRI